MKDQGARDSFGRFTDLKEGGMSRSSEPSWVGPAEPDGELRRGASQLRAAAATAELTTASFFYPSP